MASKVYSGFSSRRFSCDLQDAYEQRLLSRPVPGMRLTTFMENEAFFPILRNLIQKSSLPLRMVETHSSPDSSGFSTSRFVRWFDEKYGVEWSGNDWVKVHLMCGVKTDIVTAVEIKHRDANDSPLLPGMPRTTVANFTVKEVPADKGYNGAENIEAVAAHGAFPFIAFKNNTTGGIGGLFAKVFGCYTFNREEFLKHYHLRSNVESTFSMVKAKYGDNSRSRTDAAMKNESLCKILCHNLCVDAVAVRSGD